MPCDQNHCLCCVTCTSVNPNLTVHYSTFDSNYIIIYALPLKDAVTVTRSDGTTESCTITDGVGVPSKSVSGIISSSLTKPAPAVREKGSNKTLAVNEPFANVMI